jgi:SRSO17 transposase
MSAKASRTNHRTSAQPPASGRPASSPFTPEDIDASAEELIAFHALFQDCFTRREQREWSLFYLCGQLSNLERKTIEPMVLALYGADPNVVRAAQRFITDGTWNQPRMREHQHAVIAADLGEAEGVVIVDGSGFPKQGWHSVGVAAQYCGHLGKVANCQEGVFLVYVSSQGYAFLDERLYLPGCWFTEAYRERWEACRIPEDVRFQTEPQLALEMIRDLIAHAVIPFRWVTADASYGKNLDFLEEIARLGKWAFIEIPADTRVWLHTPSVEPPGRSLWGAPRRKPRVARTAPRPMAVRDLIHHGPKLKWIRAQIKEGSKGPLVADFALLRVTAIREGLPGPRLWLVFQRTLGAKPEVTFYFSTAPCTCPPQAFIRMSGLRWPVETTLEEGKGEVGLDHNETRTWPGWHHHLSHAFLAQLFLVHLRVRWAGHAALTTAQARALIAQAIEEDAWPLRNVSAIIHYRQVRNHAAYRSHRKRTLKRLRQLTKTRKHKTSL